MHQSSCTICGAPLRRVLLTIMKPDRFERFVGIEEEGYERLWVECTGCGAATDIHAPEVRARLKEIETAYYEADFQSSSIADKYKKVMSLPPEQSDNVQRVLRINAFIEDWLKQSDHAPTILRVLDIGAGTGVFLARFLEMAFVKGIQWEGVAVESDPMACAHLRTLQRFQVIEETYPGSTDLGKFDLCTLNKIVEHVREPVPFLKTIHAALKADRGLLYLELPDKMTIDYRPPTDNILGALHHNLYDPKSIVYLLEAAGFIPVQVMRFFEPSGKITTAAFATLPSAIKRLAGVTVA